MGSQGLAVDSILLFSVFTSLCVTARQSIIILWILTLTTYISKKAIVSNHCMNKKTVIAEKGQFNWWLGDHNYPVTLDNPLHCSCWTPVYVCLDRALLHDNWQITGKWQIMNLSSVVVAVNKLNGISVWKPLI